MGQDRRFGRRRGVTWPRLAGAMLAASVGVGALYPALASATAYPAIASASSSVPAGARVSVVVRAQPGSEASVEQFVRRMGGTVVRQIGIINGFSATINAATQGQLSSEPGVVSVTADVSLKLLSSSYDPSTDPYSMYSSQIQVGTRTNSTGAGIDVALVDSGVVSVQGLNNPGQVIYGPDLTPEAQKPSTLNLDTFGHGTFMAGIIAGHDAGANLTATGDPANYVGVAPDARIVSVKVADARGNTDVSQVIAGIDWVVQHAHDPGMNIRVLNLSFGSDSDQSYKIDPLAYAAEVAWRAGIVVVTSAGNDGKGSGGLTMPAADPFVIAVGAVDANGYIDTHIATIPSFSSRGDGVRNPDLVAPGAHVQGLRDPGSYIDATFGSTGTINSRFFRGSGTSEAAAFVSGSVAQLLQRAPQLTPDQVKGVLIATANHLPAADSQAQGAGIIDMRRVTGAGAPPYTQTFTRSRGNGSLNDARGSRKVNVSNGDDGEHDVLGRSFNSTAVAAAEASGSTWSGSTWSGSTWSGSTWSGSTWSGMTWTGSTWSGSTWSGSTWSGSTWSGSTWSGSTWSGSTWSGSTWSGSTWSSDSWT